MVRDEGLTLLDTHILIWLETGAPLRPAAVSAIRSAKKASSLMVSPITAWEIGLLVSKGRLDLDLMPLDWIRRFMAQQGVSYAAFTAEIAVNASFLPGGFHSDPADRVLVATAKALGARLVTRDRQILNYAAGGYLRVVEA